MLEALSTSSAKRRPLSPTTTARLTSLACGPRCSLRSSMACALILRARLRPSLQGGRGGVTSPTKQTHIMILHYHLHLVLKQLLPLGQLRLASDADSDNARCLTERTVFAHHPPGSPCQFVRNRDAQCAFNGWTKTQVKSVSCVPPSLCLCLMCACFRRLENIPQSHVT